MYSVKGDTIETRVHHAHNFFYVRFFTARCVVKISREVAEIKIKCRATAPHEIRRALGLVRVTEPKARTKMCVNRAG